MRVASDWFDVQTGAVCIRHRVRLMELVFQWNGSILGSATGGAMASVRVAVLDGPVEGGSVRPGLSA